MQAVIEVLPADAHAPIARTQILLFWRMYGHLTLLLRELAGTAVLSGILVKCAALDEAVVLLTSESRRPLCRAQLRATVLAKAHTADRARRARVRQSNAHGRLACSGGRPHKHKYQENSSFKSMEWSKSQKKIPLEIPQSVAYITHLLVRCA